MQIQRSTFRGTKLGLAALTVILMSTAAAQADIAWNCSTNPDSASYSGAIAAVKSTACKQLVFGTSTFTGGTTITGGTLSIGNINALGTGIAHLAAAGTVLESLVSGKLSTAVKQDPGFSATVEAAAGQTLTLDGLLMSGGAGTTLHFGSATDTGTVVIDPAGAASITFATAISVDGGKLVFGPNGLFFNAAIQGGWTVGSGATSATVDFGGRSFSVYNLTGTSAGLITNTGAAITLTTNNQVSTTFAGVIQDGTGSIALYATGAGGTTLALTGANTYTGGTTIDAGQTLQLGNGGTTGSIGGSVIDNGTLTFNHSDNISFGGVISGTGGVTKLGGGVLTLTAANTYSGGTTITGGTLSIGNINALGTGIAHLAAAGTVLESLVSGKLSTAVKQDPGFSATVEAAAGQTLTLDGLLMSGGAGTTLHFGSATDTGTVVIDPAGAASITFATAISVDGGKLVFGPNGLFFNAAIQGGWTVGSGATSATVDFGGRSFSVYNLTGTSAGLITNNGAAITLTTNNQVSSTFAGVIQDGTGSIALKTSGAGGTTLALTGANTYTGGTTIDAGQTLQLGNGGTTGSIVGNITDNGALFINHSNNYFLGGAVSGTGVLLQLGNLTALTGTNTYSGGTFIASGALFVGNGGTTGSIVGNVVDNGQFTFNRSDALTFAGNVSGSGFVTQSGTGVTTLSGVLSQAGATIVASGGLILTANDTYTGGTFINPQSFLQLGNGFANGSIAGDVHDSGALLFSNPSGSLYSGIISGTGTVTQVGTGTVLTGDNTYTGGTTINAGTVIQLGTGGTTGSIVGNVVDNGTLYISRSDTYVYAGSIAGTGAVQQVGTGLTILTGTNTYTGGTTISAGTLQVGNGGATGSIVGNVFDNTTLTFNHSDGITFAGVISGTGAVFQSGTGTTSLTGTNTYTGGTTIQAGALQIGAGGTTGSIAGNVVDNGQLIFNRSSSLMFAGNVSGSGSVTAQTGGSVLTLTGTNTNTGGTTVQSNSVLQIGNGGTSGSVTGNITNNALLLFHRSDNTIFAGNISGTGQVYQEGTGILTLTGTNVYSGATFVAFGTLQANATNTFSPNSDMYVLSGTTLDLNNYSQTTGALSGSGNVSLGSATLTATSVNNSTFSGVMSGTGSYVKGGSGNTLINGTNTYTGGTTVTGVGALLIGAGGTTGSVVGNLAINNPNSLVLFNRSDNVIFSGNISGPGQVFQAGSGVLSLAGSNGYSGQTFITGGTLRGLGTNTLSPNSDIYILGTTLDLAGFNETTGMVSGNGNVTLGSARLTLATNANAVFSGVISGSGGVTKQGSGTFYVSGTNTYSGGTTISAGTLQLANSGTLGSGTVTLSGGTLLLNGGAAVANAVKITTPSFIDVNTGDSATISGPLVGTQPFEKDGGGALVLTNTLNASFYSGNISYHGTLTCGNGSCGSGTLIFLGTVLALGDGFSVSNKLQLADGGIINVASGTASVSGDISETNGSWGLSKQGAGQLNLTGNGSYSGPTVVDQGTLVLGGTISGMAVVNAGATLAVLGNARGGVSVNAGATVQGSGTLAGLASSGTVAPGTPGTVGTLSVSGPVTLAPGSTYAFDATAGASDLLTATGAASLAGTLSATPIGSGYAMNQHINVLTAAGGVSGTFGNFVIHGSFGPGFAPALGYDATSVFITLAPLSLSTLLPVTSTANERSVAAAIDTAIVKDNAGTTFALVAHLGQDGMRSTIDQLTGDLNDSFAKGALDNQDSFLQTLLDPFAGGGWSGSARSTAASSSAFQTSLMAPATAASRASAGPGLHLWGSIQNDATIGDGNAALFSMGRAASANHLTIVGADYHSADNALVMGAAAATGQTLWSATTGAGTGRAAPQHYGLFVTERFDALTVSVAASMARFSASTTRSLALDGSNTYLAHYDAETRGLVAEASRAFSAGDLVVTPFLRAQVQRLATSAYQETTLQGLPGLALAFAPHHQSDTSHELGVALDDVAIDDDAIQLHARLGWVHAYDGDVRRIATFEASPDASFAVQLKGKPADAAHLQLGGDMLLDTNLHLDLRAQTLLAPGAQDVGANAAMTWKW